MIHRFGFIASHRSVWTDRYPVVVWQMCLAAAFCCMLLAVSGCSPPQEAELTVPIHIDGLGERLIVAPPVPKGIEIKVSGPKKQLDNLREHALRYRLDFSKAKTGLQNVPVDIQQLEMPANTKVLKFEPKNLVVRIEKELRRKVPVEIKMSGKPSVNAQIEKIKVEPAEVLLIGPHSLLAQTDKVFSKPVVVDGLDESVKKEIALDLADGVILDPDSPTITVGIEIAKRVITRTFDHVAVKLKNNAWDAQVSPKEVRLTLEGPVDALEELETKNKIEAYVDLKDLVEGVYVRRAIVSLPVGVSLLSAKPKVFTITGKSQNSSLDKPETATAKTTSSAGAYQ